MINIYHPAPNHRQITSPYGIRGQGFHNGVDFATPSNTKILSASKGKVVYAGYQNAYGNYLIIQHEGYCTLYAHLNEMGVDIGDEVKYREVIALSGNTGVNTTGPHLHFEVRLGSYDNAFWGKERNSKFENSLNPEHHLAPAWLENQFLLGYERGLFNNLGHGVLDKWNNGVQITILNRLIDRLQITLK